MERKHIILIGVIGVLIASFLYLNREDNTFYYDDVRVEIDRRAPMFALGVSSSIYVRESDDTNIIRVFSDFRRNVCGTKENMTDIQINKVLNNKVLLALVVKLANAKKLNMKDSKLNDFIQCLSLITFVNNGEINIKDVKNIDIKPFVEKQKGKDIEKDSSFDAEQKAILRANNTDYLCQILNQ